MSIYSWQERIVDFNAAEVPIQIGYYITGGNGGNDQVFLMNTRYSQYDNFQFGQEGIEAALNLRGVNGLRSTLFGKPGNQFQNISITDFVIGGNLTRISEYTDPRSSTDWIYNAGNSRPF